MNVAIFGYYDVDEIHPLFDDEKIIEQIKLMKNIWCFSSLLILLLLLMLFIACIIFDESTNGSAYEKFGKLKFLPTAYKINVDYDHDAYDKQ
jgi:hypothetical protein